MQKAPLITPVLIAGCTILMISFAIRASFGVFQIPIADRVRLAARGLFHGHRDPEPGLGDRAADLFGRWPNGSATARRSSSVRFCIRGAGAVRLCHHARPAPGPCRSWWASASQAPALASSCRCRPRPFAENRAAWRWASGRPSGRPVRCLAPPAAEMLLQSFPWQTVFLIFAAVILTTLLALPFLAPGQAAKPPNWRKAMGTVLNRAFRDPSYTLDLPGVLFLRLSVGLHHRAFPGLHHRALRPD